ncbi:MAG: hypothetical protein ACRELG_28115 [Gemmataceae bacterium]
MFSYHYRIFDLYNRQVVSLAVLGDAERNWLPDSFAYDAWGCELRFRFPIVKLLTFADAETMLATSRDPIAAMVQAHLATLAEPDNAMSLFARKRRIIRGLYERGIPKQLVLELFRLINWMITLPEALEPLFIQEHLQWEEEKKMPYIAEFERRARQEGEAKGKAEGLREGLLEAIELGLKLRFGAEGLLCLPAMQQLGDIDALRRIKQAIETATTLDDIRRLPR